MTTRVVRLAQKGGPRHIMGGIESETRNLFYTIKTFRGFFIRKRIAKALANTEQCDHRPSESDIRQRWLSPDIDPLRDAHPPEYRVGRTSGPFCFNSTDQAN